MSKSSSAAPPVAPPAQHEAPAPARPNARPDVDAHRQPPHAVILHNDPHNSMPFVIETLQAVFGYSRSRSVKLMLRAHLHGQAVVWSGMKEHAELKAEQIQSRGADPVMKQHGARPLRVSVEPMP